jgi:hypothetical protein
VFEKSNARPVRTNGSAGRESGLAATNNACACKEESGHVGEQALRLTTNFDPADDVSRESARRIAELKRVLESELTGRVET